MALRHGAAQRGAVGHHRCPLLALELLGKRHRHPAIAHPGLGSATIEAGVRGDVPLLLAIAMGTTLFVSVGNTIADILYVVADPRIDIASDAALREIGP